MEAAGLDALARAGSALRPRSPSARAPARARSCSSTSRGITAIVAANDRLALGCYDTLESHGLRCPEDVSIVGFNDMPFVDRLRPPLTTVRVPQREIGTVAADLLLAQLSDGTESAREILLEPR